MSLNQSWLRWNKMRTQQQDHHWNAGAKEIQQLKLGGLDQRQIIKYCCDGQMSVFVLSYFVVF